tara:strand:- start:806 stop:1303 length:498 start_codon:yes stop_codon:yes gene_type:complete
MKVIAVFFLLLTTSLVAAETIKIGYIDPEKVINNLPQYNQSIDQISKEFEPKKQELLDLFEHIELLRVKVNNIEKSAKKENLLEELSKLATLEESFEKETEFWQEKMNNRKIDLLQKIEQLINNSINEFAISENYDLILYGNAAFVSDKANITSKVIERIQELSL